ncbi:MAG: Phosphoglucosamine mutase [Elusimicrobia bacterium]|nr:Phosphoglucosamine mutase [Elusimicrobiota bacterium]
MAKRLAEGLRSAGVNVVDAGILSTPSVAYLVKARGFHSGVVISASHNPPEFNGIKFFTPQGRKWPDLWEQETEKKFFSKTKINFTQKTGTWKQMDALHSDYEAFLSSTLREVPDFSSFRVALDCSHGANSHTAPHIFKRLGCQLFVMGARPNGSNINVGCGSQHAEKLAQLVKRKKCDLGIAFDGDGDRVILVDEKGTVLDGDHIIALLAKSFKERKILKNNTVVITVMANLGLKKALASLGIRTLEVSVGDRFVSEAMREKGAVLGGEQSGHIILGAFLPTGDGLLTALHVLSILKGKGETLSHLVSLMKKFPQVLLNIPVKDKTPLNRLPNVSQVVSRVEKSLKDMGRVVIRYSGTEPLLRIMLEGPVKKDLEVYARQIATAVVEAQGAARR